MPPQPSPRTPDFVGRRFGSLTVLAYAGLRRGSTGHVFGTWWCQCDCRDDLVILKPTGGLSSGKVTSCGCRRSAALAKRHQEMTQHGMSHTKEHNTWMGILERCHNPNNDAYMRYGGRGIVVSAAWRASFLTFFQDMGKAPSARHTIERRDNDGPYSKENCVWATYTEQARNRRNSRHITFQGRTQVLQAWANELGINASSLHQRFRDGWSLEKALTTPPRKQRRPTQLASPKLD